MGSEAVHCFLTGGWNPTSGVGRVVLLRAPPPGVQTATSSLCPHGAIPLRVRVLTASSHKGPSPVGSGPTPVHLSRLTSPL